VASVCDLFPTVLALAGVSLPPQHVVDGRRLDTLLRGHRDPDREEVFLMHYPHAPHRSDYFTVYRRGDWKVIYHYFPSAVSDQSHYQLFNLAQDPFEQSNLAGAAPAELHRLMGDLIARLEDCQALYPVTAHGVTPLKPRVPEPHRAPTDPPD
jgi:arylsulfatase A-like enzyme